MRRFLDLAISSATRSALCCNSRADSRRVRSRALAGKILGLLFLNPSLRTLASMQAGMARLGAPLS